MTKFWETASGSLRFDPEALHEFLKESGYGLLQTGGLDSALLIKVEGRIVKLVTNRDIRDFCWRYIGEKYEFQSPEERKQVRNMFYREKSLFLNDNLLLMPTIEIKEIWDDESTSYLFFKNCILKVTGEGITKLKYEEVEGHVFERDIIDFELNTEDVEYERGEFKEFLEDLCRHENSSIQSSNYASLISIIGYLLHRFKDPAKTKAIVLMDPYKGEGANGGSGKSLMTKLLDKVRPTAYEDGKSFNLRDKFSLGQVDYNTRLLVIDDIPSNFSFDRLFPLITERAVIERKYQNRYTIKFERSPKIVLTTNYSINAADESTKRRKQEFIFSDFYKTDYTPEMKFGHLLFLDWSTQDWEDFYILMAMCLWYYFVDGLVLQKINPCERALKIEAQPKFIEHVNTRIQPGVKYDKKEVFSNFYNQNPGVANVEMTTFRRWLKLYADAYGYKFNESHSGDNNYFEYSRE